MRIEELIAALQKYDPDSVVKVAVGTMNNLTTVADAEFITQSTPSVYGLEVVIHTDNETELSILGGSC